MFVFTLEDVVTAGRLKLIQGGSLRSARYLTASDGMGFSLHLNVSRSFPASELWYKNHWEANYVLAGEVKIKDLTSGVCDLVTAGEAYQVGPLDRHMFEVAGDASHISVFSPPLSGDEVHDEDGAFTASGPVPLNDGRMFLRSAETIRQEGHELVTANRTVRTVPMITAIDEIGFSLADIHVEAEASTELCCKQHQTANFVVSGNGRVEDLNTGELWPLKPETLYCVGSKDRHRLHAGSDLHVLSVSCPAVRF